MPTCFCTLAINEPYRSKAKILCQQVPNSPWIILTDKPEDFLDIPVQAIFHAPTGPMAVDYLARLPRVGNGNGTASYHDKRFVMIEALKKFDTVIYLDADSSFIEEPKFDEFPEGISIYPLVHKTILEHLKTTGSWRLPFFESAAIYLTGSTEILEKAYWCHETPIVVKKDGKEASFFTAWGRIANFLQDQKIYSGEGGVIGLAAAFCGWAVNFDAIIKLNSYIKHEGGGPKA